MSGPGHGLCEDWRQAKREIPYTPFFVICSAPADFVNWTTGQPIPAASVDVVSRLLFMQQMHKTYPVTGTACTVATSLIPGTVISRLCRPGVAQRDELRIGHPAGIITPEGKLKTQNGEYKLTRATVDRTARYLMKSYAHIPKSVLA